MKRNIYIAAFVILLILLFFNLPLHAAIFKWFRIGRLQDIVVDNMGENRTQGARYGAYWYYDDFGAQTQRRGWHLGTHDWTDQYGNYHAFKLCGVGASISDPTVDHIVIPDEEGLTMRRYMRNTPPSIVVDGYIINEPFPTDGDEVNVDMIPGTAEQYVVSNIRTPLGISINRKVLGWSQKNHDSYLIYIWTFKNTGNVDLDDEIELPTQTLLDVYFLRMLHIYVANQRWPWLSAYGEHPEDTFRMVYAYDDWDKGVDWDNFGRPDETMGFIRYPEWWGEAILHADSSCDNHNDNPAQPQMTSWETSDLWLAGSSFDDSDEQAADGYRVMQEGWQFRNGVPYMTGTYPGTHHTIRMEDMESYIYPADIVYRTCSYHASGPFTMAPGDSFTIVLATVKGSITPEMGKIIGRDWLNGTCTWDGPYNLPPPAERVYAANIYGDDNDRAKDSWVSTAKDSLWKNANASLWAVRHNYRVPIAPPPPSITISSKPDKIIIEWGNESESAPDFAGYRVYRARGANYLTQDSTYTLIFECGEGTGNPLTHSYDDTEAERGIAYYYYVTAFDDGTHPETPYPGGVDGIPESLESGKYLNRTTKAAHLLREPGEELSDVRIVPNPFNIAAIGLQYPGEHDKIMFLNLPPECTIKIYNETGDLLRTLEHTDGSGDEAWSDVSDQYFMVTDTQQNPVSGLYIAHIETPDGESTNIKFLIIR